MIFQKNSMGEGLPGSHPHAKFYRFGLVNVGLSAPNRKKMLICGIHLFQGVYSLRRFLQNFAWGREPQDRTIVRNFNVVALKLWLYGTKNRQKW